MQEHADATAEARRVRPIADMARRLRRRSAGPGDPARPARVEGHLRPRRRASSGCSPCSPNAGSTPATTESVCSSAPAASASPSGRSSAARLVGTGLVAAAQAVRRRRHRLRCLLPRPQRGADARGRRPWRSSSPTSAVAPSGRCRPTASSDRAPDAIRGRILAGDAAIVMLVLTLSNLPPAVVVGCDRAAAGRRHLRHGRTSARVPATWCSPAGESPVRRPGRRRAPLPSADRIELTARHAGAAQEESRDRLPYGRHRRGHRQRDAAR